MLTKNLLLKCTGRLTIFLIKLLLKLSIPNTIIFENH